MSGEVRVPAAVGSFQTPDTPFLDRADHIWIRYSDKDVWKCCTCGAIVGSDGSPPAYPTIGTFTPLRYEKLSDTERALVPGPKHRL